MLGWPGCCCPSADCTALIPKTLYLTDVHGTHTLTYFAAGFRWHCCYSLAHADTVASQGTCTPVVAGAIRVAYTFFCDPVTPRPLSSASLRLDYAQAVCGAAGPFSRTETCTYPGSGGTYIDAHSAECTATKDSQADSPFLASFTLPTTNPSFFNYPTPVSGTVTVSE